MDKDNQRLNALRKIHGSQCRVHNTVNGYPVVEIGRHEYVYLDGTSADVIAIDLHSEETSGNLIVMTPLGG